MSGSGCGVTKCSHLCGSVSAGVMKGDRWDEPVQFETVPDPLTPG